MSRAKKIYPVALYPRNGIKITLQLNGIPVEVYLKLNFKETISFQQPKLSHIKTITYAMHVDDTNNYHQYDMIVGR